MVVESVGRVSVIMAGTKSFERMCVYFLAIIIIYFYYWYYLVLDHTLSGSIIIHPITFSILQTKLGMNRKSELIRYRQNRNN